MSIINEALRLQSCTVVNDIGVVINDSFNLFIGNILLIKEQFFIDSEKQNFFAVRNSDP